MGWVTMSERELKRVEVLGQVVAGTLDMDTAAGLIGVSRRHLFRLLKAFRASGAPALRHKARGRPPNNRIDAGVREYALSLIREHYADFGPTLATEMLAERHDLVVSRETVRTWMRSAGIWLSRAQRRRFSQSRLRRECLGELVQIDGSEHRWFEDRGPPCTLLVFIDDATGRLMELRFVESESTFSYFGALERYLDVHGRPVAFYSDKHSVFRSSAPGGVGGTSTTQFGRALGELNIDLLCANSSEAKGRVERANRTLQDRLVKALRLAGISDMAAGNAFLPAFMDGFNRRFAKVPARTDDLHRPLREPAGRLGDILCWREKRHVSAQLAISHERRRVILDETEVTRDLPGKYVDTYVFPDGRFEVRWRGVPLAFRVFDKNQRVTQGTIVENKRLSAVLERVKADQATRDRKVDAEVRSNSERVGYRPRKPRSSKPGPVVERSAVDNRPAAV